MKEPPEDWAVLVGRTGPSEVSRVAQGTVSTSLGMIQIGSNGTASVRPAPTAADRAAAEAKAKEGRAAAAAAQKEKSEKLAKQRANQLARNPKKKK
jgi:uncharacterized protein YqfA (UPF0365 family)